MTFTVGSLVKARGREWVVLPGSADPLLLLKPLGGTEAEVAGIHKALEPVESASFPLPTPDHLGDDRSCRLLRAATRLSSRHGAGPFRSFSRIGCEPRSYQLVPLLMALRQDPVRLLIADDVGIGKTIEACLIARELLDRGEVERLAVLAPPHLAEQWQRELRNHFHIEAELVLASTAARLEGRHGATRSLFEAYPIVVVSMDFIKSDVHRDAFLNHAPELVIVDEAHTCAYGGQAGMRHHRHELVQRLAADPARHLMLVTATPHSGKEDAFRSLLTLLYPTLGQLPEDLSGEKNRAHRERLANHFVQRRRADIRRYLDQDTPFPEREEKEASYKLGAEYRRLFQRVLAYARERVVDESGEQVRQRVRWWGVLSILRALASSPDAAVSTLRNRAPGASSRSAREVDEQGRRAVLDLEPEESSLDEELAPGAQLAVEDDEQLDDEARRERGRLLELAREAEKLCGRCDAKLKGATKEIRTMLDEGFRPIVFCRFIATAEYVADHLRSALGPTVLVEAVTGTLPPSDREARIEQMAESETERQVLVCTDCLSEGINLQDQFDAVVHYDLSWNPTRHEQREGRVDRFGQPKPVVRVLTYFGVDNLIDGVVLDVLHRKHKKIRSATGVAVAIPGNTDAIVQAIMKGLVLRHGDKHGDGTGWLFEDLDPANRLALEVWENATAREKQSRTLFAQHALRPEEVAGELSAARDAIGTPEELRTFIRDALQEHGATIQELSAVRWEVELAETRTALREELSPLFGGRTRGRVALEREGAREGDLVLTRTHPLVQGVADYVRDMALDDPAEARARRVGTIRTDVVTTRTTLLLVRHRYDLVARRGDAEHSSLAEETVLTAFRGAPPQAEWLPDDEAHELLAALPCANVPEDQARGFLEKALAGWDDLRPELEAQGAALAQALLEAHIRVRKAARARARGEQVVPKPPPDLLGVYVLLPAGGPR